MIQEKLLRALLVHASAAATLGTLSFEAPPGAWWQDPEVVLGWVALSGLASGRGELNPSLQDEEIARRVQGLAPLIGGFVVIFAFSFPSAGTWWQLWALAASVALMLCYAYTTRGRAAALLVLSAITCGLCVIADRHAWLLLPLSLAWAAEPLCERLAAVRSQLPSRTPPASGSALAVLACMLGVGGGVYALAVALLPPSTRTFTVMDLLTPASEGRFSGEAVSLPTVEIFLMVLATVGFLVWATRGHGSELQQGEVEEYVADAALLSPLDLDELEARLARWPADERRALIELYLHHLRRLEGLGYRREGGTTPRALADRVGKVLPQRPKALARRLGELFGFARWSPRGVGAQELALAREAIAAIEDELLVAPADPEEAEELPGGG